MRRTAIMLIAACAGACAARPTPAPIVQTIEVKVPVAVPCRPNIGAEPVYADRPEALAAAPDVFEAMKLRIAGREQRQAWAAVQAAALKGCAGDDRP